MKHCCKALRFEYHGSRLDSAVASLLSVNDRRYELLLVWHA